MSAAEALRLSVEAHLALQIEGAPAEWRETNRRRCVFWGRMAREGMHVSGANAVDDGSAAQGRGRGA